ncbi:MAG: rod shape-determining protein MreC [Alphaproteobacteria bacterium]|nr:MAG: rod shape-determining protein MreC [Alphaproteobacteria bacterium]
MKNRPEAVFRLTAPLKLAVARAAFTLLVAASIGLIALSRTDVPVLERVRMAVIDIVAPLLEAAAQPATALQRFSTEVRDLLALRQENQRLRAELERLQQWQEAAMRLEAENSSLRSSLNVSTPPAQRFVTAAVMADSGGAFARQMLISAGSAQGIVRGAVAMVADGLVGRVSEVGERTARVLLLTDLNSRLPVTIEGSRQPMILAGDNGPLPRLTYLSPDATQRISPGDRVVTSPHGGAVPPGLVIGTVVENGSRGILVRPAADWSTVEYVRVLDYGLRGILPESPQLTPTRGRRGG